MPSLGFLTAGIHPFKVFYQRRAEYGQRRCEYVAAIVGVGETTDRNTNENSDDPEGKGHRETEFGVTQLKFVPQRFRNGADQGPIRPVQYRNKRQHAERSPCSPRRPAGGWAFRCGGL